MTGNALQFAALMAAVVAPLWPVQSIWNLTFGEPPNQKGLYISLCALVLIALNTWISRDYRFLATQMVLMTALFFAALAGAGITLLLVGNSGSFRFGMAAVTIVAIIGLVTIFALMLVISRMPRQNVMGAKESTPATRNHRRSGSPVHGGASTKVRDPYPPEEAR